ncbi:hypothetical protein ACFQ6U_35470 [Streptomyces sp. NPDC056465]|uniref:hypothetical protein n=1 Tax=unclassified Streptomyces TaxID=2593676 RepID=UPI0035D9648B
MPVTTALKTSVTLTAAALLTAGLFAQTAGAAVAQNPWAAAGTVADVAGVQATGTWLAAPEIRTYSVGATVKDTADDGYGARVNIRSESGDGGEVLTSVSASGKGAVTKESFTLIGKVSVQECLTDQGVDVVCGEPFRII